MPASCQFHKDRSLPVAHVRKQKVLSARQKDLLHDQWRAEKDRLQQLEEEEKKRQKRQQALAAARAAAKVAAEARKVKAQAQQQKAAATRKQRAAATAAAAAAAARNRLSGLNLTGTAIAGGAAGWAFSKGRKTGPGMGSMSKLATAAAASAASLTSVTPAILFEDPVDKDTCHTPACLMMGSQVMAGLEGNAARKLRQEPAEAMLG